MARSRFIRATAESIRFGVYDLPGLTEAPVAVARSERVAWSRRFASAGSGPRTSTFPTFARFPKLTWNTTLANRWASSKLPLRLYLSLEVASRHKELKEIFMRLRNNVLLKWCLVWNVDNLQQPCVRKALRRPREVEDAKVKCRLERKCNTQAPGIWLDVDLYIAEPAGFS